MNEGVVKTLSYTSDFSPFTLGTTISDNPLPVNLISFKAHLAENRQAIDLNWTTATELNCTQFFLQKKIENQWETINTQACNEVSNELRHYVHTDYNVQPTNLYRLLQLDFDGVETEFGPVLVDVDENRFKILPNPAKSNFTISNAHKIQTITILDAFGKVVDVPHLDYHFNIQSLRVGVYSVVVLDRSGILHTQRLSVIR